MSLSKKYHFDIEFLQILDEKGKVDAKLMPKLSKEELLNFYEWMVTLRYFDENVVKLQRMGKCGTFASSLGQEACSIGSAFALKEDDVIVPSFREQGSFLPRGGNLLKILQYWGGSELGSVYEEGGKALPITVPISSQTLHACGIAQAMQLRGEKNVCVTYFGDGGTSEGDFHEALNYASVFSLPLVFICTNNHWAISVPSTNQMHSQSVAQKAIAYGIEGVQVDGNDIFACFVETQKAVENARAGKGPTLIEFVTYRRHDHTTADDATRYRTDKEVKEWEKKDPIERLEKYLKFKKILTDKATDAIHIKAQKKIDAVVDDYLSMEKEKPNIMFEHLFATKTPALIRQEEEFNEYLKEVQQ